MHDSLSARCLIQHTHEVLLPEGDDNVTCRWQQRVHSSSALARRICSAGQCRVRQESSIARDDDVLDDEHVPKAAGGAVAAGAWGRWCEGNGEGSEKRRAKEMRVLITFL